MGTLAGLKHHKEFELPRTDLAFHARSSKILAAVYQKPSTLYKDMYIRYQNAQQLIDNAVAGPRFEVN